LAVDDGCCRTSRAIGLFTAQHVKRVVQPIERAVILKAKLSAHWMFADSARQALLDLCEDCRVL
jgi:hypothetical protein